MAHNEQFGRVYTSDEHVVHLREERAKKAERRIARRRWLHLPLIQERFRKWRAARDLRKQEAETPYHELLYRRLPRDTDV